jgi:hypothetical protein
MRAPKPGRGRKSLQPKSAQVIEASCRGLRDRCDATVLRHDARVKREQRWRLRQGRVSLRIKIDEAGLCQDADRAGPAHRGASAAPAASRRSRKPGEVQLARATDRAQAG